MKENIKEICKYFFAGLHRSSDSDNKIKCIYKHIIALGLSLMNKMIVMIRLRFFEIKIYENEICIYLHIKMNTFFG